MWTWLETIVQFKNKLSLVHNNASQVTVGCAATNWGRPSAYRESNSRLILYNSVLNTFESDVFCVDVAKDADYRDPPVNKTFIKSLVENLHSYPLSFFEVVEHNHHEQGSVHLVDHFQ